jgi:pimeloyl-ACP methyl ester carboxylesterase
MEVVDGRESERVILVHGTFASSSEDQGEAWWQVGSDAYNQLQTRLPPQVSMVSEGNVFRWSGDNTDRARSKAAQQLLAYLKPLEQSGQKYHLIGHSHGGSVIWSALRHATRGKTSLKHLRSWSTVGTPFLQHRSRSPWNVINILYMLMAASLLFPAAKCFRALAALPYDIAVGNIDDGIVIRPDDQVGVVTATLRTPILKGLELLGVALVPTEAGTRLGSFDPGSGQSVGHFLFGTLEGWLVLGAIILFGYLTLLLASFFLSPVSEGLRIGWERRMEQRAFELYGARWMGLWTPDDEAINGLRATMELSVSFVGSLVVRERVYLSDLISLPSRPLYQLFAPLFNRVVRPAMDAKIREVVVKAAQGNDRPAAQVVAVSPHPILPPPAPSAPPIPIRLQESIRERANHHANDLGPKLRELLAQPSLTSGLESFSKTLSGRELVHTSYFDHPQVIELLGLNISWSRGTGQPRRASTAAELAGWFNEFKRLQGAEG